MKHKKPLETSMHAGFDITSTIGLDLEETKKQETHFFEEGII